MGQPVLIWSPNRGLATSPWETRGQETRGGNPGPDRPFSDKFTALPPADAAVGLDPVDANL